MEHRTNEDIAASRDCHIVSETQWDRKTMCFGTFLYIMANSTGVLREGWH